MFMSVVYLFIKVMETTAILSNTAVFKEQILIKPLVTFVFAIAINRAMHPHQSVVLYLYKPFPTYLHVVQGVLRVTDETDEAQRKKRLMQKNATVAKDEK